MTRASTDTHPDLPEGWSRRALRDVKDKIQDGTHYSPQLGGGSHRYITSRNVGPGYLKLDSIATISAQEHQKIYRRCDVRFGDLLLTKDGANTGNAALSTFRDEVSLLSSLAFIRTDHRFALEAYLLQYFLSRPGQEQILNAMAGNAITRLTLAKINEFVVPFPPVEEQHRIAEALSTLDDQSVALQRLIAKKEAIKQGMMQQLLAGTIRLPGFEERWKRSRLADCGSCLRGVGYDPQLDLADGDRASTVRLLRSNNVQAGVVVLDDLQYVQRRRVKPAQILQPGDVVICMANGSRQLVGKSAYFGVAEAAVDYTFGAFMGAFRTRALDVDPRYVSEVLRTERFRHWLDVILAGSSINNLRPADIEAFEAELPPFEEQIAIASVLQEAGRELVVLKKQLEKARKVKQGMMQELLSGRTRLPVAEAAVA